MDIKDLLQSLNIDLNDQESVRGASDAIQAILLGRMSGGGGATDNGFNKKAKRPDDTEPIDLGTQEQEIDPDLIQPPTAGGGSDNETETKIEDEENILNQIKQIQNNQDDQSSGSGDSSSTQNDRDNDDSDGTNSDDGAANGNNNDGSNSGDDNSSDDSNGSDSNGDGSNNGDKDETNGDDMNGQDPDGDGTSNGTGSDGSGTDGDGTDGDGTDGDGNGTDGDGNAYDEDNLTDDEFNSTLAHDNPKNKSQQIQINRTITAAQNAINKANNSGESSGITSLLEKCCEMLEDMLDELEGDPSSEISEGRYEQIIKKTLDAISRVDQNGLSFSSQDDRDAQVKKIKDSMSDTASNAELSAEDAEQIRADKQAVISNQKEIDKYARKDRSSFRGFEEFVSALKKALARQIQAETIKANSWAAINRKHDGTGVVMPGVKNKTLPNKKIPVIDFYFDCSASWDSRDITKGKEALSKIAKLEQDGEIKINTFYFADDVYSDSESPKKDGGTRAWNRIIENIVLTKATNVVIMTDHDMQTQCANPPHRGYKVSGYVWYLWKNGSNAPRLPQLLQGRSGTSEFSFSSY